MVILTLRGWASITGFSSFMPSYWHIYNVKDVRLMARARLHSACNEVAQRIRSITTKQCGEVQGRVVDRIDNSNLRACYLCEAAKGQEGMYARIAVPYADKLPKCENGNA